METEFWKTKSLQQMSPEEWDALCDHCGKCCLHKLEDEDTGEVHYTQVACRYLDDNCSCKEYSRRKSLVPECIELAPEQVQSFSWLPATCAYRLLAQGEALKAWHPLISGNPDSVHGAGVSVKGKVLSEDYVHVDDMEEHVVSWVDASG